VSAPTKSHHHWLSANRTHPGAWWIAGIALSLTASLSSNLFMLVGICALTMLVVRVCRDESPWSRSIRFYLFLGALVVLLRVAFRIVFNLADAKEDVVISLPSLSIDLGLGNSLHLLGSVSALSLQSALTDGFRLAAIILAIGMANSLANPRKLLRATPGALYEVATAISIAINLAPQLIQSLNRVRRSRGLRGHSKGIKAIPGIVIPVLEDTIDQSMQLAASMSARGFGRKGNLSRRRILLTRLTTFLTLILLVVGVGMLLFSPAEQIVDLAVVISGFCFAFIALRLSSARTTRTQYIRLRWSTGDAVILTLSSMTLLYAFAGGMA